MSKQFEKLEEVLDLPPMNIDETVEPTEGDLQEALERAKELESQVSKIDGFEKHDEEMDDLAEMAIKAHKDLQDLGMNVEIRHAGEIFSSSIKC